MPNDGIRLKIILIIEVRKLEFTDFDSHSLKEWVENQPTPTFDKEPKKRTATNLSTYNCPDAVIIL